MKMLTPEKATRRVTLLRLNILIGLIAFFTAVILMITGEYSSLAERKEADQLYNMIAIGSLIYMAIVWFTCVFSKPFWKPKSNN